MSLLPRVTERARELLAREFDTRGPEACMAEIIEHLEQHNPELLDMAPKCAGDLGNPAKAMLGFSMFYRLEDFTMEAIAELEGSNPELLQMAHNFASGLGNYLHGMQCFALLYKSLVIQSTVERARLH
jgi:hypothetical protein